ncbi:sodium-independent sulfate anion transporter-like [Anticarsia gemmatalis]|uniref:sodium-independent sulfate anion transporter-like n=1 Tax=Anticarsia gemmatalis TaxID=129554 RepID=UPI003F76E9C6
MTIITEEIRDRPYRRKAKKCLQNTCSTQMLKKRLPVIGWLPKYKAEYIIQDFIAGITVGLTAIPQGIAYAVIAGLSPEHGLYASLTSGIVYVFFGSCYNVTVGPTAILAAMTARYVTDYSADFAILAAFLAGVFILLLGVLNLGFLVEFISMPVISGFTNAAALQIAASQLKSYFGLKGSSGNYFSESVYNFFVNIKTAKIWEPVLATSTIIMLILLKKMGEGCKRTDGFFKKTRWFVSLSRNAVVVVVGMIIAYVLKVIYDSEPLILIGDIGNGLPTFSWPPFGTVAGNQTISFIEMVQILGFQSVVIPFVAILETVAIAKAFAEGGRIDATQEMIAIGLCNIIGSFGQSMPITGSFTRTALNHVSGVKTPAGGITKVLLLVIALTYLTDTFYYIPKASLAGLIITAMFSMMDYQIFVSLWQNSKRELLLLLATMIMCLFFGLEYGIVTGILLEALFLLYNVARPAVEVQLLKCEKGDLMVVNLCENVSYCAAEYVRQKIFRATSKAVSNIPIVLNGGNLKKLDFTAAFNLMAIIKDLDKTNPIILLNFNVDLKKLCLNIDSSFESKFVYASSPLELTDVFPKNV